MSKLDCIKINNLYSSKNTVKKIKGQSSVWEEIYANHVPYKEHLSRMHKELLQLNNKKKNNLKER